MRRLSGACLVFAGLSGAGAIALAAATGHGSAGLPAPARDWLETGLRYQLLHALALLGIGALAAQRSGRLLATSAGLLMLGSVLFCGSLYLLAATGRHGFALATPFGGLAFILGWLLLAWYGARLPGRQP
ncbi:MAG TPA: DUF423 domain-containing protein [Alphaproteobacteria bacterium]|nr:DUF423 domain-containing protein [Alphaproteobacteria bacterium]